MAEVDASDDGLVGISHTSFKQLRGEVFDLKEGQVEILSELPLIVLSLHLLNLLL